MSYLNGLRIVEVGHFVAAPFATRLLADYGAEVIKVEPPKSGDPMRELGQKRNGSSLWWSSLARNKKCVTIDLRQAEGQELFLELVEQSDAVVENFRAGQLENWGIGWETIHKRNPKCVLTRVSGFGQTGPNRDRVAFAPIGEAYGGLRHLIRDPKAPAETPPLRASLSLGDSISSLFAALGTLTALFGRTSSTTGEGTCVDVSLFESVFALLESSITDYGATGLVRMPAGSTVPNLGPSNTYLTADGIWVCVAATSDRLYRRLCDGIGKPELKDDPRFKANADRAKNREQLDPIIGGWVGSHTYEQVDAVLAEASIPASKIYDIKDCAEDPHYAARGAIVEIDDPLQGKVLQPNILPLFGLPEERPAVRWAGPKLGQHNEEVLEGLLGHSREQINDYRVRGVI